MVIFHQSDIPLFRHFGNGAAKRIPGHINILSLTGGKMKRLSIIILTLVFALSGALAAQSKMVFETTELDFGELDAGKSVELTFKFKNAGNETLIITNINSSCGCTVPRIEKKEFRPGETGVIPIKFNSRGLKGKIVKTITIVTNDRDNEYTTLKIKGTVTLKNFPRAQIEPRQLDFKTVKAGEEYSQSLKIKNTGTADLRIIEVAHSPRVCFLFAKDVVAPGKKMDVKIVFTPIKAGRFATFMRIRTNSYQQSFSIVKLIAVVKE
jgi:hypothetical protein